MDSALSYISQNPWATGGGAVFGLLLLVAIHDVLQKKHAIKHNFPIVGHLRYWLESIGPELRQYWVANDKEEKPFNRQERAWIYASSKKQNKNLGFGSSEVMYSTGYPIIKHRAVPVLDINWQGFGGDPKAIPCSKILGATHGRAKAFRPQSILYISAMSYGSLGDRAVRALNSGARDANLLHNTGEGGVSPYHQEGGDLIWQIGTGYYGCRTPEGKFNLDMLAATCERVASIKAIEIKMSQGAKPGKGGILPAKKVTAEVAQIRGIPQGKACLSPNGHTAFSTPAELIAWVEQIAERTGLPVGIKSAIGELGFWEELAAEMKKTGKGPDYINIDGGEGGTGAAPLSFADHVALPFKIGFARVYQIFQAQGLADDIVWFGAGQLGFPDRAIVALAMGVDMIGMAREAMLAIGCIQAMKCHTDHCPAGIATQNRWLQSGVNVTHKGQRMAQFAESFRQELLAISHAAGYRHPGEFTLDDIEVSTGVNKFSTLTDVLGYKANPIVLPDDIVNMKASAS